MVLDQKWLFLQTFFFGNRGKENVFNEIIEQKKPFQAIVFHYFLEQERAFLGYKKKKLKKSKN